MQCSQNVFSEAQINGQFKLRCIFSSLISNFLSYQTQVPLNIENFKKIVQNCQIGEVSIQTSPENIPRSSITQVLYKIFSTYNFWKNSFTPNNFEPKPIVNNNNINNGYNSTFKNNAAPRSVGNQKPLNPLPSIITSLLFNSISGSRHEETEFSGGRRRDSSTGFSF